MALSLCIVMSGLLVVSNSQPTQAKSLPEALVDLLTGRNNTPAPASPSPAPTIPAAPASPIKAPAAQSSQQSASSSRSTATTSGSPVTTTSSAAATAKTTQLKPADTSAQVREVVAAQAVRTNLPSRYDSAKIANSERNDFYRISIIAVASGSILYLLSFANTRQWFYRNTVATTKTVTQ